MANFQVEEDSPTVVDHPASPGRITVKPVPEKPGIELQTMMLALSALSKRALVALSNCFTGAALASAWLLWDKVLPDPSVLQLVGLGGYAIFLLSLEWIRRR